MSSRPKLTIRKKRKNSVIKSDESSSSNSSGSNSSKKEEMSQKSKKSQNKQKKQKKLNSPKKNKKSNGKKSIQKLPTYPTKNLYLPHLLINNLEYIERFKCGLCERICENPRYQYCGCNQVYCEQCLNIYYESYNHQCPKCQKETKELIPARNFFESLNNLKMKCNNIDCPWNGIYKDYKKHIMNECPKEIINCPNKGCIIKMKREDIQKHKTKCEYRVIFCKECLAQIIYSEKKTHKNFCPRAKIPCPQGCEELIEREDVSKHKKVCKYSDVHCPYKLFGCKDKYPKNQRNERLVTDVYKHLDLTANVILELKKKINVMEKEIIELKKNKSDIKYENNNKDIINNGNNNIIINNNHDNQNIDNNKDNMNNNINDNNINNYENDNNNFVTDEGNEEFGMEINSNNNRNNSNNNQFLSKKRLNSNNDLDEELYSQDSNKNFSIFNSIEGKEMVNNDSDEFCGNKIINENIYEMPKNYENFFYVNNDIIETYCLDESKHYFIFFNKKYDIPKNGQKKYSFTVKLLTKCDFLTIGICDKKIIEQNNYEYDLQNKINMKINTGMYSINVNKVLWNCNNNKQCIKITTKSLFKPETTIMCIVDPKNNSLDFILDNEGFFTLTNVKCFESNYF